MTRCRGNCDNEREQNDDNFDPEGPLLANPSADYDRPQLPVADQSETDVVFDEERKLPSASPCRRRDCDKTQSQELTHLGRLATEPVFNGPEQLPVADQPEDAVPGRSGEGATDAGAMMGSGQNPAQKTEFVVHVQQQEEEAEQEPKNVPPSPRPDHQHHHHQRPGESDGASRVTGGVGGGSRRRHHRLPCWEYERQQRQCLNGGHCFAIELHNGIRRSGCRSAIQLAGLKDHRQRIPRFVIRRYLEKSIQKKLFAIYNHYK